MLWVILALICAPIAASIYGRKGRSAAAGFVVGLIFGPIGLLLVIASQPNWDAVQRCPRCRALNGRNRNRCAECGGKLIDPSPRAMLD